MAFHSVALDSSSSWSWWVSVTSRFFRLWVVNKCRWLYWSIRIITFAAADQSSGVLNSQTGKYDMRRWWWWWRSESSLHLAIVNLSATINGMIRSSSSRGNNWNAISRKTWKEPKKRECRQNKRSSNMNINGAYCDTNRFMITRSTTEAELFSPPFNTNSTVALHLVSNNLPWLWTLASSVARLIHISSVATHNSLCRTPFPIWTTGLG